MARFKLSNSGGNVTNLFMRMHENRTTIIPIVSMNDKWLMNTIRYKLIKLVEKNIEEFSEGFAREREALLSKFAPPEMSALQCRTLGKRPMTAKDEQMIAELDAKAKAAVSEAYGIALMVAMEDALPYILVAAGRETTYVEVHQLIQQVTGITAQIPLPGDTIHKPMSQQEVLELTGGYGEPIAGEGLVGIDDSQGWPEDIERWDDPD